MPLKTLGPIVPRAVGERVKISVKYKEQVFSFSFLFKSFFLYFAIASCVVRMRSNIVVRVSDCQCISCNGLGFYPSIRLHSGI